MADRDVDEFTQLRNQEDGRTAAEREAEFLRGELVRVREAAGDKLFVAQRNEAKREADELLAAGNYLLAALRFYVPRPVGAYYSDFHAAARRWEDVAGPVREAASPSPPDTDERLETYHVDTFRAEPIAEQGVDGA